MAGVVVKLVVIAAFTTTIQADLGILFKELQVRRDLEYVLIDMLNGLARKDDVTCLVIICDAVYLNVFKGDIFKHTFTVPFVMIVVEENEDLLSPNFNTLKALQQAKLDGCNMYAIIMANGFQVTGLLRFGDRYRILDTRAKYIILHDVRLFHSSLHYIWKRIVNVVFLKYHRKVTGKSNNKAWFDISTVPFPNPIKSIFISRRVDTWSGKFHYNRDFFAEKTGDLNSEVLNVVYFDHLPSVVVTKLNETNKVGGVEIEILNTLAKKMNFVPNLYEPNNSNIDKWGQKVGDDLYSGLLGEVVSGKADLALGNLQHTPYHLELLDLSNPYTLQCWTFLTPEALSDNSWKTLILPFKLCQTDRILIISGITKLGISFVIPEMINLYMWIAVLLVLLVTGSIFYGLANYYINLLNYKPLNIKNKDSKVNYSDAKPVGLYLFGEITNSILYTYGMLLVVSLPKLPTGWSIRLLTGWYWLYCILLVVSYRASMTAILANPAPRVTIDTLKELVNSKIACGGWGEQTKQFFERSLDEMGQKISDRFENVDNPEKAAEKIAKGVFAYYDSSDFLKYMSVKRKIKLTLKKSKSKEFLQDGDDKKAERNLHIMSDCVVNIPISIGFYKNSPLKPLADIYIQRIIEVGLVEKWLGDIMYKIRSMDKKEEEIKALINLKKLYCAFIALAIGYSLSFFCLIGEFIHWNFIVKKDPSFDKYAVHIYYMNKNKQALEL